MGALEQLRTRIFADGADLAAIVVLARNPLIRGFTTNPPLMRKAGVTDYPEFARRALEAVPDRPISFEVLADEPVEMERQARRIASWGENVYVKIPVTNTKGEGSYALVERLCRDGIQVNVTAVMTLEQVAEIARAVAGGAPCYVSVFAGRIADTGRDPVPLMTRALELLHPCPQAELLWASPREVLNLLQADAIGCPIITVTGDLLTKLGLVGKPLEEYSLETVRMFFEDARAAGYRL
ncbi:MAG: transaldolase [Candidatus Latescibacterota bacterium]|jgi:transaldolase